jgi:hypothetical protein
MGCKIFMIVILIGLVKLPALKGGACGEHSGQNNVPFQPSDDLVSAGKNSQIKTRKSEHGFGFKSRLLNMILSSKSRPGDTVPFNAL